MFGSAWSQRCYVLLLWHFVQFLKLFISKENIMMIPECMTYKSFVIIVLLNKKIFLSFISPPTGIN